MAFGFNFMRSQASYRAAQVALMLRVCLCLQHQLPTCKLLCTFTPQLRCRLPDIAHCGPCLSLGRQQLNSQFAQSQCEHELQNASCLL